MTRRLIYRPHHRQLEAMLESGDRLTVIPEADDGYLEELLAGLGNVQRIDAIDAAGRWERWSGATRRTLADLELAAFLGDALAQHEIDAETGKKHLVWLRDVSDPLREGRAFGRLKALASLPRHRAPSLRILLTGHEASAPPGLAHLARVEALERPRRDQDARNFVEEILVDHGREGTDDRTIQLLLDRLRGLDASAIRRLLARACGSGDEDLAARVKSERDQMLATGVVEVREIDDRAELGGLDVLQAHLSDIAALLDDFRGSLGGERALELLPKGLLLLGPPGCGKSLAAEAAARIMGVPLLQLHTGRLMDRYLGGSEERLESALAIARSAAPCVLWIDELEKALGGFGNPDGGGTERRLLGRLLSWMQDNRHGVYVIATANSISRVPPELLRRGRFDDHFLLDLPNERERNAILRLELKRHGQREMEEAETQAFAKELEQFSGADIAALVREAARRGRLLDFAEAPRLAHLQRAKADFEPQSKQLPEQQRELKQELEKFKFRKASSVQGDARPLRDRDKARGEMPSELTWLAGSTEPRLLRWPSDEGEVLELVTLDARRFAKLGRGDERGVQSETARYEVIPGAGELTLARIGGSEAAPRSMKLAVRGGTLSLLRGERWHPVESQRLVRERSLHPSLWPWLAGYALDVPVTVPEIGDGKLRIFDRSGSRTAALSVQGVDVAEYRLTVEGAAIRFEPSAVWPEEASGRWLRRHALVAVGGSGTSWTYPEFLGEVAPLVVRLPPPEAGGARTVAQFAVELGLDLSHLQQVLHMFDLSTDPTSMLDRKLVQQISQMSWLKFKVGEVEHDLFLRPPTSSAVLAVKGTASSAIARSQLTKFPAIMAAKGMISLCEWVFTTANANFQSPKEIWVHTPIALRGEKTHIEYQPRGGQRTPGKATVVF
jgi:hypothetical protein